MLLANTLLVEHIPEVGDLRSRGRPPSCRSVMKDKPGPGLVEQRDRNGVEGERGSDMPFPPELKRRYLDRLEELAERGNEIQATVREEREAKSNPYARHPHINIVTRWDAEAFLRWKGSCVTILDKVLFGELRSWIAAAKSAKAPGGIRWLRARLLSVRDDLEAGFLDDVAEQIEGEIAANYMAQADALLGECEAENFSHVPAAVLAGAVLERHLRELCMRNSIDTHMPNGRPKTMDPMITDLAREGVLSPPRAQILRGHAAIRNRAAHGDWDTFSRQDVEGMVRGIQEALAW